MIPNPQYDYDYGPNGPLAALQARSTFPRYAGMVAPPIGWVDLVLELDRQLAEIIPDYTLAQVKEKFAGLRYYLDSYGVDRDDPRRKQADQLIAEAEHRSQSMCQICGQDAIVRTDAYWYATLCDEHVTIDRSGKTST